MRDKLGDALLITVQFPRASMSNSIRRLFRLVYLFVGAMGAMIAGGDYVREHHPDPWRYFRILPLTFAFSIALTNFAKELRPQKKE